jgi:lysophospholipase L1-like esterase
MKRIFALGVFLACIHSIAAQPARSSYWEDIQRFKKQDSISFPAAGKILFVGSSSFTRWTDVQEYFPGYTIINRGFGGSTLKDVRFYEKDIIFPYLPKQIIMYCGENDIANDSSVTGKIVFKRFKKLYRDIRHAISFSSFIYISMKPSPSRWNMRHRMQDGNRRIRHFLDKHRPEAHFLNVWDNMLDDKQLPDESLFVEDKLHMNPKGYAIWQRLLLPYLLK